MLSGLSTGRKEVGSVENHFSQQLNDMAYHLYTSFQYLRCWYLHSCPQLVIT